ncbi:MAG: hypothetical protein OJF58_003404 [Enhydrobacter sp.]|jgi:hypothetical protein|nr:MAG: hypothetical protein OJF58_003404 [Enhydrobacter sp.]
MGGKLGHVAIATVVMALATAGSVSAQSPAPAPSVTPNAEPDTPTDEPKTVPSEPKTDQGNAPADSSAAPASPAPAPPASEAPPPAPPAPDKRSAEPPAQPSPPADSASPPSVTVIGSREVQGILGNEVRGPNNESMGRVVDVIVDGEGKPRAAIIDFGGFLGVGSRKIAVDWKALHFVPGASKRYSIALALTRDQVKAAPEYKEGQPIVILGASGSLEPIP